MSVKQQNLKTCEEKGCDNQFSNKELFIVCETCRIIFYKRWQDWKQQDSESLLKFESEALILRKKWAYEINSKFENKLYF